MTGNVVRGHPCPEKPPSAAPPPLTRERGVRSAGIAARLPFADSVVETSATPNTVRVP